MQPDFVKSCRRVRHALVIFFLMALLVPVRAMAVSFPLNVEFDDGITGTFATIDITENDDALDFEIAAVLDTTSNSVAVTFHRARTKLQEALESAELKLS